MWQFPIGDFSKSNILISSILITKIIKLQELKAVYLEILSGTFNLPEEALVAWSKTFDIAVNYIKEGLNSTNS